MPQPRSILQLVLLGFLVVLAPVLLALAYSGKTMSSMSQEHRDHLIQVNDSAEHLQRIAGDLTDAERLARQYLLLSDPSLLELFNQRISALNERFELFRRGTSETRGIVDAMQDTSRNLERRLNTVPSLPQNDSVTLDGLEKMNGSLQDLRTQVELELRRNVEAAKERARSTQKTLLILSCLLVPATLLLVAIFSVLITRPIQEIERQISEIGTRVYDSESQPRGPRDLQLVAQKLIWLRDRLHSSEESQERFLRHISHELKTPLASIKEGVELLSDEVPGPLSPQQRSVLDILLAGVQHFQVLINNLLDFNLMRGERLLKKEQVDLKTLIESVVRPHLLTAQRKDLAFEILGQPQTLLMDRSVIAAALDNLVSNAVQFSPDHGKITLQWANAPHGVTLLVGDEGPGIDQEERAKVFLPFYQGKAQRNGPLKGTGLGLSVAKECIESHKGVLKIVDAKKGAWFEIFLPEDGRFAPA